MGGRQIFYRLSLLSALRGEFDLDLGAEGAGEMGKSLCRILEADHVDGQVRCGFCARDRKFLQRLVNGGVKVFFTALLADDRGNLFDDLELVSPVKIDADFSLCDFSLTKVAFRHAGIIFSCAFSNHLPTLLDHS